MSRLLQFPRFYAAAVGVAALVFLLNFGRASSAAALREQSGAPRVVVLELFTSEGCSSCPPADALLKEISEQQEIKGVQIVALEEHVDYWNHLGWKDPYSAAEFSQRQDEYAHVFGSDGVYTPQMVVDGLSEFVGSRRVAAREAIEKAATHPKADIALVAGANSSPKKFAFEVQVRGMNGIAPRGETELWLAVTEKGLQTNVRGGENSGETLKHAAVVRILRKIETVREPAGYQRQIQVEVDPRWKKENLAVAVFLVEKTSHKIIGAVAVPLDSSIASSDIRTRAPA